MKCKYCGKESESEVCSDCYGKISTEYPFTKAREDFLKKVGNETDQYMNKIEEIKKEISEKI